MKKINFRSKIIYIFLLMFIFICINNISFADEITHKITVKIGEVENGFDDLKTAIASASSTEKTYITLNDNIEVNSEIKILANTDIVIDGLSKYKISRGTLTNGTKYTKTFFNVAKNAKLTLNNLMFDGGNNYTFDETGFNEKLKSKEKETEILKYVIPEETGILTTDWLIKNAGEIKVYNSTFKNFYSKNSTGIFSCSAGAKADFDSSTITHVASNGGGIAFNISGANIEVKFNGNSKVHDVFVGSNGGIFKIYNGAKVEMNGGEISNVCSINCNGLVSMTYGTGSTFTLNGGVIKNNRAIPGINNGRNAMIYIHSGSKYIMNGGLIEENTGFSVGGIDAAGHSNSSLELNSGTIKNNLINGSKISRTDVSITADYDIVIGEGMNIEGYVYVDGDVTNNGTIKGWVVTNVINNINEVAYKGTGTVDGDVIIYHPDGQEPKVENRENILGDPVFVDTTEVLAAVIFADGQVNEKGRYYELHDAKKDEQLNIDDPVKKGHSTSDYYLEENLQNVMNQPVTDTTIVYAKFIPNKYTTIWEVDGEKIEVEVTYGEEIKPVEEPKKEGYTFLGWTEFEEGTIQDDLSDTYTAIWEINKYNVKFMINETEIYKDITTEYNSVITKFEDPTLTGMIFDGWYEDSGYTKSYSFESPIKSDMTIYAKWKSPEVANSQNNDILNPKTTDDIYVYVTTLTLSIIAILSIFVIKKKIAKNKFKKD